MKEPEIVIMINGGEASIIQNPNNLKCSIMNYDGISEPEIKEVFQDFEDLEDPGYYNEDLGDVSDNYHIDKAGIPYKEQGNI